MVMNVVSSGGCRIEMLLVLSLRGRLANSIWLPLKNKYVVAVVCGFEF